MGLRDLVRRLGRGRGSGPGDPERRGGGRVRKFGWARYGVGETEGEGLATDLSLTGIRLERCTAPLELGTKVELRLKPSGGYPTVELQAEVVREIEDGFGLRFTDLSEEAGELIAEVVRTAI